MYKKDLALNNLQGFICCEIKPNQNNQSEVIMQIQYILITWKRSERRFVKFKLVKLKIVKDVTKFSTVSNG